MARKAVEVEQTQLRKMSQTNNSLSAALAKLGLEKHLGSSKKQKSKASKKAETSETINASQQPTPKRKSSRKSNTEVFTALQQSSPISVWNEHSLAIDIPGGRVLTYNVLYSLLQKNQYVAYAYKKLCKSVIRKAIKNNTSNTPKPFFDGPVRLTLLRTGKREIDLDSFPVVFKYFIDSLKDEQITADDNPNIIVEIKSLQSKGDYRLGMKLEKISDWEKSEIPTWQDFSILPSAPLQQKKDNKKVVNKKTA